MEFQHYELPYPVNPQYSSKAAYFCMEFAIHQSLKIYSGGLGFLAGSHLRSAYEAQQNFIGIGILWKYGYYDQERDQDQNMKPAWVEKQYNFLEDTGIKYQITIGNAPVWVKAWYLKPETFKSAPLFLLSTDLPENDYLSQSICHRLYDSNMETKIAQFILLGIGGAKLLDLMHYQPDVYHLNEAHGISAAFYVLSQQKGLSFVKNHFVFTTHTPEEAGNEVHDLDLCQRLGYFNGLSLEEVREATGITGERFNHSLAALRLSRKANGVSALHGEVSRTMWANYDNICPIISITNAQNRNYWADKDLYEYLEISNDILFDERKLELKAKAFEFIANQTGKIFDPNILTIVWARRFAAYKRPDLLSYDFERFERLITDTKKPIQIIWAGKPYPSDFGAVNQFNKLVDLSKKYKNIAVVTGYELDISRTLKQAADVWLNNPRVPREASGTSGMTATMNGALNFSTDDGWIPEFIVPDENGFVVPKADYHKLNISEQDIHDLYNVYEILEDKIIPTYYSNRTKWRKMQQRAMKEVVQQFDSKRMVKEYYEQLYS